MGRLTILEIYRTSILSENGKGLIGRRSLLAREGKDNEVAEENFWEEMDKMCREENYIIGISTENEKYICRSVVEDSWRKFMSDMWEDRY